MSPLSVISPVNDILSLIITPFICESIAVTIDILADGPSLLIAPSVKLIWKSLFKKKSSSISNLLVLLFI